METLIDAHLAVQERKLEIIVIDAHLAFQERKLQIIEGDLCNFIELIEMVPLLFLE